MSKYCITEIKENFEEWDNFILKSPQGSIFSLSSYFRFIGKKIKCFFVKKGNEYKAGLVYVVNDANTEIILDDLIIYNGIFFAFSDKQKETRQKSERFEITEFVISFLDEKYKKINIQMSPNFEDMRPFLWHNYSSEVISDKFSLDLRYTSFLNIYDLFLKKNNNESLVYQSLDNRRQADIKKAIDSGMTFFTDNIDTKVFVDFYKKTLNAQGQDVDENYIIRMENLINNIVDNGIAKKYAVKDKNGCLTYIVIFGIFNNTATYIFGAGDNDKMERYDATFCIWKALNILNHNYGISMIDMEGINSPNRGSFKLDFGGNIVPYYNIIKGY